MKVAYVTTYDASDIGNWSGIGYFMAKALEEQSIEIVRVGPLMTRPTCLMKAKRHFYQKFATKNYHEDREPVLLLSYANQVAERLNSLDVDLVFSPGTIPICYLKSTK